MAPTLPDSFGHLKSYNVGNPGVGNEFNVRPPLHERWRLYAIQLTFAAVLAGGSRWLYFKMPFGIEYSMTIATSAAMSAGAIVEQNFTNSPINYVGMPLKVGLGQQHWSVLPDPLWLTNENYLQSFTRSMNANDTYRDISVYVEAWLV